MKIVSLCKDKSCCPRSKIEEDKVEIGEKGNLWCSEDERMGDLKRENS